MTTRIKWDEVKSASERIDEMQFGESDLEARKRIFAIAERELSLMTDGELQDVLSLATHVPYAFYHMQREYYETARRVVEKRRQIAVPLVPELERATFEDDVLVPALQNFWFCQYGLAVGTERMLDFISLYLDEEVTPSGVVLICKGVRYATPFSHPVEAKRMLANYIVHKNDSASSTYVWPTEDSFPWFRNEEPAYVSDLNVKLLAVTDTGSVIVTLRIDQLPQCLNGRRAFYAYDMDTKSDLEDVYPFSSFGVVVRDDGMDGIPLFGEEDGTYLFSRVSRKYTVVPVGQLLSKFPISDTLLRMVFFHARYSCWCPSFEQLSCIVQHQVRQKNKIVLVGYAPDGVKIRCYSFKRGKLVILDDADYLRKRGYTILVTSRFLMWELSDRSSFVGVGVDLRGIIDISDLVGEQSFLEACGIVMKAATPEQAVFFSYGTSFDNQRPREHQSARPYDVLCGDSELIEWVAYYQTVLPTPYFDSDDPLLNIQILYAVARALVLNSGWQDDNYVKLETIGMTNLPELESPDVAIAGGQLWFTGQMVERLFRSRSMERYLMHRRYDAELQRLITELGVLVSATNWVEGNLRGVFLRKFFISYCCPVMIESTMFYVVVRPHIARHPDDWQRQLMDEKIRDVFDSKLMARPNLEDVKVNTEQYNPNVFFFRVETNLRGEWFWKRRNQSSLGASPVYQRCVTAVVDYLNTYKVC